VALGRYGRRYRVLIATDDEILARVRAVPRGRVTTYGDLSPGAPRRAGAVLAGDDDPLLPWQRVVRADGSLAKGDRQRALLEAEGVPFRGARVDMRAAWVPAGRTAGGGQDARRRRPPARSEGS
jgi:alkylated DNA nucleotide flippase Atl1